jgi:hypothetical protein
MDHAAVMVQPAGPAGKRSVYLTLAFGDDDSTNRRVEFVLSEQVAHRLGEALISGSVGIMREFDVTDTLE